MIGLYRKLDCSYRVADLCRKEAITLVDENIKPLYVTCLLDSDYKLSSSLYLVALSLM